MAARRHRCARPQQSARWPHASVRCVELLTAPASALRRRGGQRRASCWAAPLSARNLLAEKSARGCATVMVRVRVSASVAARLRCRACRCGARSHNLLFKKDRNKHELIRERRCARRDFRRRTARSRHACLLCCACWRGRAAAGRPGDPEPHARPARWRAMSSGACSRPCSTCCRPPVPSCSSCFSRKASRLCRGCVARAASTRLTRSRPTSRSPSTIGTARLVDEFQDTSFSQLDLLERLHRAGPIGDGRTLFCVGDPMQSIYRFRQAEVGCSSTCSSVARCATCGWSRSGWKRISARGPPGRLGERAFPACWQRVATRSRARSVQPAIPRQSPSLAACTFTVRQRDDDDRGGRVVSMVRETLERSALGTIAVLVAARTHVDAIARELATRGRRLSGGRDRAAARSTGRAGPHRTDACPGARADRTAWLAVLRAPWCGLALADLHALADAGDDDDAEGICALASARPTICSRKAALSDDGRERLQRALGELAAALGERGPLAVAHWVERTWNALGGPATLTRRGSRRRRSYFARLEQIGDVPISTT